MWRCCWGRRGTGRTEAGLLPDQLPVDFWGLLSIFEIQAERLDTNNTESLFNLLRKRSMEMEVGRMITKNKSIILSFLVCGCASSTPESIRETYSVTPTNNGTYTAFIEVRDNHAGLQDRFSVNAFNKLCGGTAEILVREISAPFQKTVTITQHSWHAASRQMIQTASYPAPIPHVRMTYQFKCP